MNNFVISDTHFGHANILTFTCPIDVCPSTGKELVVFTRWSLNIGGGDKEVVSRDECGHCRAPIDHSSHQRPIRPGFTSVEEMDERIVGEWNKIVRPQDHVWHLGDVCMKKPQLAIVKRLNGKKRLVPGNHDIFEVKDYLKAGFQKVQGMKVFEGLGLLCTHIPVHEGSLSRWKANIHGHIHEKVIANPRYVNVSVERTGYRPVSLDEIVAKL